MKPTQGMIEVDRVDGRVSDVAFTYGVSLGVGNQQFTVRFEVFNVHKVILKISIDEPTMAIRSLTVCLPTRTRYGRRSVWHCWHLMQREAA